MSRAKAELPPMCGVEEIIGSYPGEGYATCHLPPHHTGEHEGTVYWDNDDAATPAEAAGIDLAPHFTDVPE